MHPQFHPMHSSYQSLRKLRRLRLNMLVILLIAYGLRVYCLGCQELRGDEAFGYFFSLRSFGGILRETLALKEPHPVASYFLQHVWLDGAGYSEFALRFISVWCGVAGRSTGFSGCSTPEIAFHYSDAGDASAGG